MSATAVTPTLASAEVGPDGRIWVHSDYRVKDQVKQVPGARWDTKERVWALPLTWPSCLALRAQLGPALKIMPSLREWAFAAKRTKDFLRELHTTIEGELDEPVELPGFADLYPYQKVGAEAIATARHYMLFDETGTGKSRTSLAGLALARHRGEDVLPLLIVAPKSMLTTWGRDEVPNFFPDATVQVVQGTPSQVRKQLEPGLADIYVASYGAIRTHSRHAAFPSVTLTPSDKEEKELNKLNLRSIVLDEAHRVKNPKSKQTRAAWQLGQGCEYRITLTGSPIQDTPEDLWSILRFVAPDEYPTKTSYVDRFLRVAYNEWGGREIHGLEPTTSAELLANLETRYRRVTKDVALPFLPDKVVTTRWVELPPKARKAYEAMVDAMVAELEGGDTLVAKSVLERAGRLTQLANASGSIDADGKFHMELPSPKIDAFLDDVLEGDYDGQQVVVFSDSRQLIELLSDAMDKKKLDHLKITGSVVGADRDAAKDAFQAGKVQFLLLTRAGGEGLTLTAASTMVRLVRAWSSIVHQQAEDRVHRIGSERHDAINIVDYVTADTVEEGQLARLNRKRANAQEVLRDAELLEMLKRGRGR